MEPKISVCITTRGKDWLLSRTIEHLQKQTLPNGDWELIVIDDNSPEPIDPVLNPLRDAGIQVRSFRLEHADGWRGITVGMLYAFAQARAEIVAESNSHLLLPPHAVELLYEAHRSEAVRREFCRSTDANEAFLAARPGQLWVSLRVFNLNTEDTCDLDQVDWRADVRNLRLLPHTEDPWTKLWSPGGDNGEQLFGTHLCCSIRKDTFRRVNPWPETGIKDYGTDDPAYAGARARHGVLDLNVWPADEMIGHLAHNTHTEDALELVPTHLNRKGHTSYTARLWDPVEERHDKPTLQEAAEFWERGGRTTDWRVRTAWGWPCPAPAEYSARARQALAAKKVLVEDLFADGEGAIPERSIAL